MIVNRERPKEASKIILVVIFVIIACYLTYYNHAVLRTGTVFTHFFYIPIILASIWWGIKGIFVSFFLTACLLSSHLLLRMDAETLNDFYRAPIFILVSIVVALLSTRLKKEKTIAGESEKRFRTLVENSLSGLSIIQDNKVVYQNREQERLLGPLPRSPKFMDIDTIYPDDVEKVKNYYQEVPLNNFPMRDIDFRFYPQNEKRNYQDLIWVHCRSVPIEHQGKEAILVNMTDITPIKQMEHLLRMQDKMESLGRIASGVAHEIRNPLSGVNVFLDGIKENFEDPDNAKDIKDLIDQAKAASNKIESIVKRVLDFSRPSLPKLELRDINIPIKEAINLSQVSLRKKEIEIERNLSDQILQVHIDSQLIEQVLLNMLTNAAEALKDIQGRKAIAIASTMEKDSIIIKIGDSGPGVEADIQEKIFDPFYTTRPDGSGIGLSICQRIISDHGGRIEVSKSELGGAEFIIRIPQQSD